MKKIYLVLLCCITRIYLPAQCNISQPNFFLNYSVATCNGLTFQSALGAPINPYGNCNDHYYTSVFSGNPQSTDVKSVMTIEQLDVYPNPSYGLITIVMSELSSTIEIAIISSLGVTVLRDQIVKGNKSKQLDLSSLESGCYFIQFVDNNRVIKSKAIIKTTL